MYRLKQGLETIEEEFQFLNGSIKSEQAIIGAIMLNRFQFLNGSIKSFLPGDIIVWTRI